MPHLSLCHLQCCQGHGGRKGVWHQLSQCPPKCYASLLLPLRRLKEPVATPSLERRKCGPVMCGSRSNRNVSDYPSGSSPQINEVPKG